MLTVCSWESTHNNLKMTRMIWVVQNCANIISGREALHLISLSVIAFPANTAFPTPKNFYVHQIHQHSTRRMHGIVCCYIAHHVRTVGTCAWDVSWHLGRVLSQFTTYGNHWDARILFTELFPVWQLQLPTGLGYAPISGLIAEAGMQMFRRMAFAFIAQKFRKRQWDDTVKVVSRGTPRSRMSVH